MKITNLMEIIVKMTNKGREARKTESLFQPCLASLKKSAYGQVRIKFDADANQTVFAEL